MHEAINISVVIPVYGCKAALEELCQRLVVTLTQITNSYEIIFVDDCCPQNSWEIIEKLCSANDKVKGYKLSRNFGQMAAILAGLDHSQGEKVVVMDCDLQDSPEDILKLYQKSLEGYDIVYSRRKDRHDNRFKISVSKGFYKIYSWLSDDNFDPALSNFSICSRKVIDNYCGMRELHRAFTMYLRWMGFNYAVIDVDHNYRKEGKSSYTMKKRLSLAMDILVSQSDKLLKFIAISGLILALMAFIMIIILVISYFVRDMMIGWTSMIASIFLVGGIIMTAIGVVGLYVGNIFMQTKNRPLYVINNILNGGKEKE